MAQVGSVIREDRASLSWFGSNIKAWLGILQEEEAGGSWQGGGGGGGEGRGERGVTYCVSLTTSAFLARCLPSMLECKFESWSGFERFGSLLWVFWFVLSPSQLLVSIRKESQQKRISPLSDNC